MFDFDGDIDESWRTFRGALGDALAALREGDSMHFSVEAGTDDEGAPPFVTIKLAEDQLLLAMTCNELLSEGNRLRKPARRRMRELGFNKLDGLKLDFETSVPREHPDHAAHLVVSAMRESYGVLHPTFLIGQIEGWRGSGSPRLEIAPEPLAAIPAGRMELDAMIEAAIAPMFGECVSRDDDGDIGIRLGTAMMFVRTRDDEPVVEFIAQVVTHISDCSAALDAVNDLNQHVEGVRFAAFGEFIYALHEVVASPFAPAAFRAALTRFGQVVSDTDAELAARVDGRVFLPEGDDEGDVGEEEMHPVMLQILQLDAEKPGSLRPKHLARICGYDPELITELIGWNEEQEIAWRHARDAALHDPEEQDACEQERAHAEATVRMLRKALRRLLVG